MRVYELYPTGRGQGFTHRSVAYDGRWTRVAANSLKEAVELAYRDRWIERPGDLGIFETYRRDGDPAGWHLYWCGCRRFHDLPVEGPGSKSRALIRGLEAHRHGCDYRERWTT